MPIVFDQVRHVFLQHRGRMVLRRSPYDPPDLRPPESGIGRVRVLLSFGKSVMHAVGRYPFVGRVLYGHRREGAKRIFEPLGHFKSTMRKQAVPTETDAEAAHHPVADDQYRDILPAKGK